EVTIALERSPVVRVTLRDAGGAPLREQRVTLEHETATRIRSVALTDSEGRATFADVVPGPLVARLCGERSLEVPLASGLRIEGDADIELRAPPLATVSGRIVDPS